MLLPGPTCALMETPAAQGAQREPQATVAAHRQSQYRSRQGDQWVIEQAARRGQCDVVKAEAEQAFSRYGDVANMWPAAIGLMRDLDPDGAKRWAAGLLGCWAAACGVRHPVCAPACQLAARLRAEAQQQEQRVKSHADCIGNDLLRRLDRQMDTFIEKLKH